MTTTAQTITVPADTTEMNPVHSIATAWNRKFKRNPMGPSGGNPSGGGGGGGGGGSGGGGGGGDPPLGNQQVVQVQGDVRLMGALPNIFTGDRNKAAAFIESIKQYIRLNDEVPSFRSPMKKVALTLTLMQGEEISNWV